MSRPMSFHSTRGQAPAVGLSAAIAAGIAPDGGLYVPDHLPPLDPAAFAAEADLASLATQLLMPFFSGDPLAAALPEICREAFTFAAPLRPLQAKRTHLLELFHGPTAAFKDFGARFLAACLARLTHPEARPLTILVATSGDTGAAVGAAFAGRAGLRVAILYPDGKVSPRQAHQLGSFAANVRAFKVDGRFDDCQRLVKHALNDHALQAELAMSSANSISLGRLLPQMVYYAASALGWWRAHGEALNLIIPTGNLGNALAAVWVRAMGLPVGDIVLACNANRSLVDFFQGESYHPREAISTLANAMDVGAPSNFERLQWTYPQTSTLRQALSAYSMDDDAIRASLRLYADDYAEVICPHTATAAGVLSQLRAAGDDRTWSLVATAHPAKFETVLEPWLGRHIKVPTALQSMLERPAQAYPMAANQTSFYTELRKFSHDLEGC